jgi:hypothetical protein
MMKNINLFNFKRAFTLGLVLLLTFGCERDISDDAAEAGFPKNGDVFIDGFSAGLDYFPYADSFQEAFSVDTETTYNGSEASMRFDVPNVGDPAGAYAGAIFRTSSPRDLSGFDALTFWAKATQAYTINDIGFGQDFGENKYQAEISGSLQLTTNWRKYTIPIPDPSKLTSETGLLWFAEGPQNGMGYTFWLDDVKFEKLGNIAQPRPAIDNGMDTSAQTFIGAVFTPSFLTQTVNLGNGQDVTVKCAPSYFDFNSSNPSVASVDEFGKVLALSSGTSVITASLDGVDALGSFTLDVLGEFIPAPTPTQAPENVISIFSDAYTNVPVDYYNGYFAPFQTTQGQDDLFINGDNIISYTNLNFVGVGTFLDVNPVNTTGMTHFHVDINIREDVDPGDFIRLELLNGVQTTNEISGSVTLNSSQLNANEWLSFDIPLGEFSGLSARDALGLIFFVSDATISSIYVDNIYYYKEVLDPSPNVDDSEASEVALPVGFESATLTYNFFGFEGAVPSIIANPDPTGINPTANVMQSEKTAGALFYAGNVLDLDAPIDLSSSQKLRMKIWSPKANIPIRVALETSGGGNQIFVDATVTSANEWVELEWDFGGVYNPALNYQRIIVFFEFIDGLAGDGSTYYFDDLQIID